MSQNGQWPVLEPLDAVLYKVRDYVNTGILKAIYHALCIIHALYRYRMYAQSIFFFILLKKKGFRLIHFKNVMLILPFLFQSKMVKRLNQIKIENCLFISKYVNNKLPLIFNGWFLLLLLKL